MGYTVAFAEVPERAGDAQHSDDRRLADKFLIWWTNQSDCERITPLDSWPTWLYDEFNSRMGRAGRGRLWIPRLWANDPEMPKEAVWQFDSWTCQAANDAAGIVIPSDALRHVQFLPGFVTTFAMALPDQIGT
jgi:hypothetical protein